MKKIALFSMVAMVAGCGTLETVTRVDPRSGETTESIGLRPWTPGGTIDQAVAYKTRREADVEVVKAQVCKDGAGQYNRVIRPGDAPVTGCINTRTVMRPDGTVLMTMSMPDQPQATTTYGPNGYATSGWSMSPVGGYYGAGGAGGSSWGMNGAAGLRPLNDNLSSRGRFTPRNDDSARQPLTSRDDASRGPSAVTPTALAFNEAHQAVRAEGERYCTTPGLLEGESLEVRRDSITCEAWRAMVAGEAAGPAPTGPSSVDTASSQAGGRS
ncbi:MAG: hypothetical protein V1821_01775 [bacterium]